MTNNYFKVTRTICHKAYGYEDRASTVLIEVYPFDGNDLQSTQRAYREATEEAQIQQGRLVVYRRPSVNGPWRDVRVVGENYVSPSESERGAGA